MPIFFIPFRNQIVIKGSFTDINVGTIKWIRVHPETSVDWILKEVQPISCKIFPVKILLVT